MSKLEIYGGKPLRGEVKISGAKNEALKLIAFSLILHGKTRILNMPEIDDVLHEIEIIKSIGAICEIKNNVATINTDRVRDENIRSFAGKLRASIVLIGPMLARYGRVNTRLPGGCLIGTRPIDTHTEAFKQLGAKVKIQGDVVQISLDNPKSREVRLKERSVTATENLLMYAAGVESKIEISNCAIEPEILALVDAINKSGAKVENTEERTFVVSGSKSLHLDEIEVISDRLEAGSFAVGLLVTGGAGKISPFNRADMPAFINVLDQTGANYKISGRTLEIMKTEKFWPIDIKTAPHPGFPTDLQSPMALLAAKANGESTIFEAMFEKRLGYINELEKMGLRARMIDLQHVKILGPSKFCPTKIDSLDLRSGITLLIAALMTEGRSLIDHAEIIDRGYEKIEEKFAALGAQIKRIE